MYAQGLAGTHSMLIGKSFDDVRVKCMRLGRMGLARITSVRMRARRLRAPRVRALGRAQAQEARGDHVRVYDFACKTAFSRVIFARVRHALRARTEREHPVEGEKDGGQKGEREDGARHEDRVPRVLQRGEHGARHGVAAAGAALQR
eukprot:4805360-Pleurochrysis_carterae.AAC.4